MMGKPEPTMKHQIHETHIGSVATPAEARAMAERLTALGYPSEYTPTEGGSTGIRNPETDELEEIPDSVWCEALAEVAVKGGY